MGSEMLSHPFTLTDDHDGFVTTPPKSATLNSP
jgi:hypothetical protein